MSTLWGSVDRPVLEQLRDHLKADHPDEMKDLEELGRRRVASARDMIRLASESDCKMCRKLRETWLWSRPRTGEQYQVTNYM